MDWNNALEHRHNWFVEWEEPWPGLGPEGNKLDCFVTNRMSVHDAINFQRFVYKENKSGIILTDLDLFKDFVVIHWAEIKAA
jgi:hypothetical protein